MESRVGTAFGKYTIISLLGKGGMGEVYEAYDTEKKRTVALKILADGFSNDATFRQRFQRESHAAAVLQEPHVIPIHDWHWSDAARTVMYKFFTEALASSDITFISPVNGEPFTLDI